MKSTHRGSPLLTMLKLKKNLKSLHDSYLRLNNMPFIVLSLQNDLHRLVLRQQSALSQKVLVVFGTVLCILFTG